MNTINLKTIQIQGNWTVDKIKNIAQVGVNEATCDLKQFEDIVGNLNALRRHDSQPPQFTYTAGEGGYSVITGVIIPFPGKTIVLKLEL